MPRLRMTFLMSALWAAQVFAATPTEPSPGQPGIGAPANAWVAPRPELDDTELFASPTRLDHIGRVVAPVMINGKGPFRFIVDTGATTSTVSPALAKTLGLDPTAESGIKVNGITGTAQVPSVSVALLQAGDLVVENSSMPVVWAPLMAGADGILGAAGLTAQRLLVDFQHNRVVISHSGRSGTPSGFMRIPAKRIAGGLMTVDARIDGVRVCAVIDTGAERSLGNPALLDALNAKRRQEAVHHVAAVYGATTEVVAGNAEVAPTMAIDALRIADVTLVYGDFHIFKVWDMQDKPAMIIGMDILGTVDALSIDFQHQEVFFAGKRLLAAPGPGRSFGIAPPGAR
jgi:predicted aspartyl protease